MAIENPLIIDILELQMVERDKKIILVWIPSHVRIPGNTKVDNAANEASQGPIIVHKVLGPDFKPFLHQYILNSWQWE